MAREEAPEETCSRALLAIEEAAREENMSDTYKALVIFEDGVMANCAAVKYQGTIWLVPKWLREPDGKSAKPERMIRLDQFRHQVFDPPANGPDPLMLDTNFAVNDPLPRSLVDGALTQQLKTRYIVLEKPDIVFDYPRVH
jgi:hypothetical protein